MARRVTFKKNRKPRGLKKNGSLSRDMCSCGYLNCDSAHGFLKTPYIKKLDYRRKNKLCYACGKKPENCICKSR